MSPTTTSMHAEAGQNMGEPWLLHQQTWDEWLHHPRGGESRSSRQPSHWRATLVRGCSDQDELNSLVVFFPGLWFWPPAVQCHNYKKALSHLFDISSMPRHQSKCSTTGLNLLFIDYPNGPFQSSNDCEILPHKCAELIESINHRNHNRVILAGHSFGTLLARRVLLVAAGSGTHTWHAKVTGMALFASSNLGFEPLKLTSVKDRISYRLIQLTEFFFPLIDVKLLDWKLPFFRLALQARRHSSWMTDMRIEWPRLMEGVDSIGAEDGSINRSEINKKLMTLYINGTADELVGDDDMEDVYHLGGYYKSWRISCKQPGSSLLAWRWQGRDFFTHDALEKGKIFDPEQLLHWQSLSFNPELLASGQEMDSGCVSELGVEPTPSEAPTDSPSSVFEQVRLDIRNLLQGSSEGWRQVRRVSDVMAAAAELETQKSVSPDGRRSAARRRARVIFLIHGIRDFADWQENIEYHLRRLSINASSSSDDILHIVPISYGYFTALQFLFRMERRRAVRAFTDSYLQVISQFPSISQEDINVYAHSNGTFVFAEAIRRYKSIRVNRVLFGGSVLPTSFAWRDYTAAQGTGQVRQLINYCANRDYPTGFLCRGLSFPWLGKPYLEIGPAGTDGFATRSRGKDVFNYYIEGDHGATNAPGKNAALRVACFLLGLDNIPTENSTSISDYSLMNPFGGEPNIRKAPQSWYRGVRGWSIALSAFAASLALIGLVVAILVYAPSPKISDLIIKLLPSPLAENSVLHQSAALFKWAAFACGALILYILARV